MIYGSTHASVAQWRKCPSTVWRGEAHSETRKFADEFQLKRIEKGYPGLKYLYDPCRKCKIILENSSNPEQEEVCFVSCPLSEFGHVTLYRVDTTFMLDTDSLDECEVWEDLTVVSSDGLFSFVTRCRQKLTIEQCDKFGVWTASPHFRTVWSADQE